MNKEPMTYNLEVYNEETIDELMAQIGKNIRDARLSKDWSVNTFSECSNMSEAQIYKIESGSSKIGLESFLKAQIALGVPANILIPNMQGEDDYVKKFLDLTRGLNDYSMNYIMSIIENFVIVKKHA